MNGVPLPFDDPYPRELYDGRPPAEPRDAGGTSREAASAIAYPSGRLRQIVYETIRAERGGLTDDEIELLLGLRHQTASPRRRELVQQHLVADSGLRRRTRSGRRAIVWQVAP